MPLDPSVARFLLVGVGNTLTGLAVIFAAKAVGVGDVVANATGYAVGIALSFALNRRWTFRHEGPVHHALARFLAVTAVAYLANLAVVLGVISTGVVSSYLAQVAGVPAYTLVGYLGSRWYAFPEKPRIG
jgi:putative flippase GtrA